MAAAKKEEIKFELIQFHGNWADEMDIASFIIKPKGYLPEVLALAKEAFKIVKEIEVYAGTNEILYFTDEDPENPYRDTLGKNLSSQDITSVEKTTLEKLFTLGTSGFNIDILGGALNVLISIVPEEIFNKETYPIIFKSLSL